MSKPQTSYNVEIYVFAEPCYKEILVIIFIKTRNSLLEEEKMTVVNALKTQIVSMGVTQSSLANKLDMSSSALCRKLSGQRTMYLDEFAAICRTLGVSADKLIEKCDA